MAKIVIIYRKSVFKFQTKNNDGKKGDIINQYVSFQEAGLSFVDVVEKIAAKFSLSKERAESEVSEYWNE